MYEVQSLETSSMHPFQTNPRRWKYFGTYSLSYQYRYTGRKLIKVLVNQIPHTSRDTHRKIHQKPEKQKLKLKKVFSYQKKVFLDYETLEEIYRHGKYFENDGEITHARRIVNRIFNTTERVYVICLIRYQKI